LSDHQHYATFNDADNSGSIGTDNTGTTDTLTIELGAGPVAVGVDSLVSVSLDVTYTDGTTISYSNVVMWAWRAISGSNCFVAAPVAGAIERGRAPFWRTGSFGRCQTSHRIGWCRACTRSRGNLLYHVLFDKHEIIFAEGAPSENLFTGPEALKFLPPFQRMEISVLLPELAKNPNRMQPCRPFATGRRCMQLVQRHIKNNKPLLEA